MGLSGNLAGEERLRGATLAVGAATSGSLEDGREVAEYTMEWKYVVLYGYFTIVAVLAVFGAHRYHLLYLFYKYRRREPRVSGAWGELPAVTVQLPIFNEATVVERLIEAVARIDYPREKLEVQVLDDSTDETCELAERKVEELRLTGLDIVYIHRTDRTGFKAGALDAGMSTASGEFIAIFDADFVPEPDMLRRALDYFTDPKIGMVQTRWGHLNRDYSLLTRLQSMLLDGHFVIEHTARNRSGRHFNFNGTAGVWRRTAIRDAGGWQHDTLTEDLDLSYRAQLEGWKFVYLLGVTAPAELPVEMNAFKTQQHRWAKGSIQTGRKLLPRLWRSDAALKVKLEATFHLTANCAYPMLLAMCLMMLPALNIRLAEDSSSLTSKLFDASIFVLATISVFSFYVAAQAAIDCKWYRSLRFLPGLMALGVGLAVNNSRAVVEAAFSQESPFVRTPKYNVGNEAAGTTKKRRYRGNGHWLTWVEIGFGMYISIVMIQALSHQLWLMSAFLSIFAGGFFYVGISSLIGAKIKVRAPILPLRVPAGVE